jgi:hypothetical protein
MQGAAGVVRGVGAVRRVRTGISRDRWDGGAAGGESEGSFQLLATSLQQARAIKSSETARYRKKHKGEWASLRWECPLRPEPGCRLLYCGLARPLITFRCGSRPKSRSREICVEMKVTAGGSAASQGAIKTKRTCFKGQRRRSAGGTEAVRATYSLMERQKTLRGGNLKFGAFWLEVVGFKGRGCTTTI